MKAEPTRREPRVLRLEPAVAKRLGVKSEPAGSQEQEHRLQVPGSIDYNLERVAQVGAVLEGRVASVLVKVGDRVTKGQTLATVVAPSLATAHADYLAARAEAEFARDRLKREESLSQKDLTTAQEVATAKSELAKGEAHLAAAEARLRALRIGVPQGKGDFGTAGLLTLTSPIDGTVMERNAMIGAFLRPDETAFVVADLAEVWAILDVFEADVPYLRIGADVQLSVDALPGSLFTARLSALEPKLGRTSRSVRARSSVPNPEGRLRPGFFVRAAIELPHDSRGLLVAASAVQPLDDGDAVFVERSQEHYEIRPVRVVRRTAELAEISEGLVKGEPIVVKGAFLLRGEVSRQ